MTLDVSELIDLSAQIDYTSLDWVAILMDALAQVPTVTAEWTDLSPTDFGVVLLELWSGMADNASYRIDVIANEGHFQTAITRKAVEGMAELIDYTPNPAVSALATIKFTVSPEAFERTIVAGTKVSTEATAEEEAIVFETYEDITVAPPATEVTGSVVEGESIDPAPILGSSTGLPFQFFSLGSKPLGHFPDGASSLEVYVTAAAVTERWEEVETLIQSTATDQHYETNTDEDGNVTIQFGDGKSGKIPPAGTDNITARARIGGGAVGNVGAATIKILVTPTSWITAVANDNAASGGADRESIASIKRMAPRTLRTVWKAVTREDYKTLAEGLPGVARANPVCLEHGGKFFNHVGLYIAPEGGGLPSQALKDTVAEFIHEREVLTVTTSVEDPTYVDCTVDLEVWLQENALRGETADRIDAVAADFFSFENMDFGKSARRWDFTRDIDEIPGVDYGLLNIFSRTGSGVGDIVASSEEILRLTTYTLTLHGGIE